MTFKLPAFLLLCCALPCFAQTVAPSTAEVPTEPIKPVSFDLSAIDKTADPCTDFYKYACGNWKKNNPIPDDQVYYGRFDQLNEHTLYLLYQQLTAAAAAPQTPMQKQYGDYFAACMNKPLADELGTKPVQPILQAIAAWQSRAGFATFMGSMEKKYAIGFFFDFGNEQDQKDSTKQIGAIDQGGLSLPDRDYYLQTDDRMKTIREQYVAHMTKMFILFGDTPARAKVEAANVLTVETALAKGSMPRADHRDPKNIYHVMTIADLQKLTPLFDWKVYLADKQESSLQTLDVVTPGFFKTVNAELSDESLPALRSYLRWHVMHRYAASLSAPIATENFNFFAATLAGQKQQTPRWKRCTNRTDEALGEAVSQDWVKVNFPPTAKDNMEKLIATLEAALGKDIQSLDWMDDATRAEAEKKLAAFREKVGYPSHWRDYSKLIVHRDDPIGNLQRSAAFEDRWDLDHIGRPVDEQEWLMTPPTVNAYYDPPMNDINFPAGILQPPFFDYKADPAQNYGSIGVIIGHEMTHGFDDQGSQYDGQGNVREWWSADDRKKFTALTDCEVKEYGSFEAAPGQKLDGKLTLGENTADNGGLRIAYAALMQTLADEGGDAANRTVDGYTEEQRYFLSFGQTWCEDIREQFVRVLAKSDPHSPGYWRVNGSVQNFPEFGKAFGCKVGQPMMPVNACRVW